MLEISDFTNPRGVDPWHRHLQEDLEALLDRVAQHAWLAWLAAAGSLMAGLGLAWAMGRPQAHWNLNFLELGGVLAAIFLWSVWSLICMGLGRNPVELFGRLPLVKVMLLVGAVLLALMVFSMAAGIWSLLQAPGIDAEQRLAPLWLLIPGLGVGVLVLLYAWWRVRRGSLLPRSTRSCIERAEEGDPEACHRLGQLFLNGEGGCPKDVAAARLWIQRAARADHVEAALQLARMAHAGLGGPKDFRECKVWALRAKDLGHPEAGEFLERLQPKVEVALPVLDR